MGAKHKSSMGGVITRRDTDTHREGDLVRVEAEIEVMSLQAMNPQGLPATARIREERHETDCPSEPL